MLKTNAMMIISATLLISQTTQNRICPGFCFVAGKCLCNAGYMSLGGKRSIEIDMERFKISNGGKYPTSKYLRKKTTTLRMQSWMSA